VKISTVHITNFKSLADTNELELGAVNVLVGRNNHGKSAFIRALLYMQQGEAFNPGDVRLGEQNATVELSLQADDLATIKRYFHSQIASPTLKLRIVLGTNVRDGIVIGSAESPSHIKQDFMRLRAQEPDNFMYTYLSKRKVLRFDRQVNLSQTIAVQHDLRNLVAKVSRLANSDYERSEEYAELCKALLGFRISVHAAADGNGQQAGIPVGRYGYIPIESMGEGVSSQLGLITDLCMADGNLFLLEEPENDIHPESLKTLLNVIVEKSAGNQFIVTTHSNIVTRYLGAAPGSKIFEFESNYVPNTIPTSIIREVEPTAEARIAVLRRLGYELSDFDLWEGWLILEESSAEVIIRYLIPWFVPRLARVRTVAAGGTSKVEPTFEDFRRLFLFAHLEPQYRGRAWVIVDGDDEGKEVVASLQRKYMDWPADHFVTWKQPDFEAYYPARFAGQVEAMLAMPHDKKPAAKKSLLDEVKAWCDANQKEAKEEFEKSAAEVIEVLRRIEDDLLPKTSSRG
jgi:AAA domain, putative AbiEii toxin, Type IV TA system